VKALSIRQPWAWLIVTGYKDIENRSWRTNYRGPLLIHAGRAIDPTSLDQIKSVCLVCDVAGARARGWRTGSGWVVVIGEEDFVLGLTGGSDAA
jgi:hypothetical protein